MRPFKDVLAMWGLYSDRELLDWHWTYERLLREDLRSRQCESILQDYNAIGQILQRRKILA